MPDQQLDRQAAQNVAGFVKSLNLTSDLKPRDWAELADRLADEIHAYEAALAAAEQERDEARQFMSNREAKLEEKLDLEQSAHREAERITLEGAAAIARSTNPLADAITVLKHVAIENPSERPDTEDAQNRVALAIGYLRMADEIMRSLAKDNYVQGVIVKLGGYDRCELIEARKVIAAVDAYCEDSTPETRLALHVAAENFAMALPALQGRAEP